MFKGRFLSNLVFHLRYFLVIWLFQNYTQDEKKGIGQQTRHPPAYYGTNLNLTIMWYIVYEQRKNTFKKSLTLHMCTIINQLSTRPYNSVPARWERVC